MEVGRERLRDVRERFEKDREVKRTAGRGTQGTDREGGRGGAGGVKWSVRGVSRTYVSSKMLSGA